MPELPVTPWGLPDIEPVAKAMAEWSSSLPWDARHPNHQAHWRRVALAVMTATPEERAVFLTRAEALRHA